jgi:polycystin 1L2
MLVNAMWYERVPPKPNSSALDIGPFSLSPEQIGIGFFSNLIVFPPTFLIIIFFRRSRLKTLRPSRISEALRKQNVCVRQSSAKSTNNSFKQNKVGYSQKSFEVSGSDDKSFKKKKKRLTFPWWCRYIGWFLCLLSISISIFFLLAYGIQFGDEKTRKWVTSLVISFFASILVTQPIKVFLTAIILSTLFKVIFILLLKLFYVITKFPIKINLV